MHEPDPRGYFGRFGGRFVPEVLVEPLRRLEAAMQEAFAEPSFWSEYRRLLRDYVGRPTPLTSCENLSRLSGRATIVLKREDCNHTGAHKINNALGQGAAGAAHGPAADHRGDRRGTARRRRGDGRRAVQIPVVVYMGAADAQRQALNVYLMRLLGASVEVVRSGSQTLKDATNEALRDWAASADETFYLIGSAVGPHPYPFMVRALRAGHRRRGARAGPRTLRQASRPRDRLRRRRQQRARASSRRSSMTRTCV